MMTDKEYEELQNKYYEESFLRRKLNELYDLKERFELLKEKLEKHETIVVQHLILGVKVQTGWEETTEEAEVNFNEEELYKIINKKIISIEKEIKELKNDEKINIDEH